MGVPSRALAVADDSGGLRQGLVGAAPKDRPYWPLFDQAGDPWARLALLFPDEGVTISHMYSWFREQHGGMLGFEIRRRLREVKILPEAEVRALEFDTRFWLWCRGVMAHAKDPRAPESLLAENFDVLRVGGNLHPRSYELVIVTEEALREKRVLCSEGWTVIFNKDGDA